MTADAEKAVILYKKTYFLYKIIVFCAPRIYRKNINFWTFEI